jgi:sugar lactone lactonase YvrE
MRTTRQSSVVLTNLGFTEGLRWHDGELWFSDFRTRNVISVDPSGTATTRAFVPAAPSGLGWSRTGDLLVASMIDQQVISVDAEGRRRSVASLAGIAAGPLNDMLVDEKGTVYVGCHGGDVIYRELNAETFEDVLRPAPLYMISPAGDVSAVTRPLKLSNGMAKDSDGRLIVTESMAGRLLVFDVADDGTLSNERVFADLGTGIDGITIDAEGAVWACLRLEARIARVKEGGEIVDQVETPGRQPVDCAMGGPDGLTLYAGLTYPGADVWGDGEVESSIESWRVDVPGPA